MVVVAVRGITRVWRWFRPRPDWQRAMLWELAQLARAKQALSPATSLADALMWRELTLRQHEIGMFLAREGEWMS